jgi:predicted Fe-Mo cluster-binding NifX family protein
MKIVISSTGKDLESEVDPRFGRCKYFLIIEAENKRIKEFKAIENIGKNQSGAAGITAGQIVANQGVDSVITTNLGPKAFSIFDQFKIKIFQGQGKIKNVIEDFFKGKLRELSNSNAEQHHGNC